MAEFIFEIDDVLYDEETGQGVMKPEYKGKLTRCKECKHWDGYFCHNKWWGDGYGNYTPPIKTEDGFCDWAVRKDNGADKRRR